MAIPDGSTAGEARGRGQQSPGWSWVLRSLTTNYWGRRYWKSDAIDKPVGSMRHGDSVMVVVNNNSEDESERA